MPPRSRRLRFAIYHLNSAANPADERVSIGAPSADRRRLSWTRCSGTQRYPATLLYPDLAGSRPSAAHVPLLHARCRAAKSARMGWRGALYAWESAEYRCGDYSERLSVRIVKIIISFAAGRTAHQRGRRLCEFGNTGSTTEDEGFLRDAGAEFSLRQVDSGPAGLSGMRMATATSATSSAGRVSRTCRRQRVTNVMARWTSGARSMWQHRLRKRWPECWASLSSRLGVDDTS